MIKTLNIKNLKEIENKNNLYDSVILSLPIYKEDVTKPFIEKDINEISSEILAKLVTNSSNLVNEGGYLFIYGTPTQLIEAYKNISNILKFRYWISIDAVDEIEKNTPDHLKHNHLGILMISKGNKYSSLDTKNTRLPYMACSSCGRNVKDWGGKKHLMNTKGAGVSDVWRDFYKIKENKKDPDNLSIDLNIIDPLKSSININQIGLPENVRDRLLSLIESDKKNVLILNVGKDLLSPILNNKFITNNKPSIKIFNTKDITDKVILGDCIVEMEKLSKEYPEGVFDLVFADPPYNLKKDYKLYDDTLADQEYIDWCNKWLELCVRLTKPTGSIFILNIPKWALEHANYLNKIAYLQNWIVWDALSTPKGKIMPAHYSLLYYTKSSNNFTFNQSEKIDHLSYCVRNTCVSSRHHGLFERSYKVEVSDFWSDLHRIKHKKDRDDHPCQLPNKLMDRIIKTFSNAGDLIFDPFAGVGTTAIRAIKNDRKYTTIEIDPTYKEITEKKLIDFKNNGEIKRDLISKKPKSLYTKKYLETKAQELAVSLGGKPTLDQFIKTFALDLSVVKSLYQNPENVLKAGRISLINSKN